MLTRRRAVPVADLRLCLPACEVVSMLKTTAPIAIRLCGARRGRSLPALEGARPA
ncbi:hypothetical protein USDA257_c24280 [Sinorhizobium fredii USDA 257]|uniref:Uncharacterized protein n=1 Tax=Sinorhizobium fredii (strain USDA 257) TaxID=1185652 RepID=I3X548_SINF2|nr:hypothetical protein USDA257_c24280 [Sinorhizobium fredii USDA 257]